jgi:hypothetical protein
MDTANKNVASTSKFQRLVGYLKALRLSWTTVVVMAVVLAFADGFVLLAFQGAVGAVERQSQPFRRWIVGSVLMVPFFVVAIVVAMILTRRWAGKIRRTWAKGGVAVLLIVASTALLGAAMEGVSGAYDYTLQSRHIDLMVSTHSLHNTEKSLFTQPSPAETPKCDAACRQKHDTIVVHIRSVFLALKLMLLINLVLTAWVVAVRGGRLWATPKRKRQPKAAASVRLQEGSAQPALV